MESERVQKTMAAFRGGMSCSQALLTTYGTVYGFDHEDALRIARGFGGGMGRLSETCGAVSGAFMAMSLSFNGMDKQTKEENYALMQEFSKRFKAKHGSLNCGVLLGCDLNETEGQAYFREKGMMQSHCEFYVRHAAEILEELLDAK